MSLLQTLPKEQIKYGESSQLHIIYDNFKIMPPVSLDLFSGNTAQLFISLENNFVANCLFLNINNGETYKIHHCKETFIDEIRLRIIKDGKYTDSSILVAMERRYAEQVIKFLARFEKEILEITNFSTISLIEHTSPDIKKDLVFLKVNVARRWFRCIQSMYVFLSIFKYSPAYEDNLSLKEIYKKSDYLGSYYTANYVLGNLQSLQIDHAIEFYNYLLENKFQKTFTSSKDFLKSWQAGKYNDTHRIGVSRIGPFNIYNIQFYYKLNRDLFKDHIQKIKEVQFNGLSEEFKNFILR